MNVGASTIEPEQGFRPRGLIFSIGPMEDDILYSDGVSLSSLDSETSDDEGNCIPMHFPTHPGGWIAVDTPHCLPKFACDLGFSTHAHQFILGSEG